MRIKRRTPITATLFSIIAPGLGQVYNGQLIKGVLFSCIPLVMQGLMLVSGFQYHFYSLIIYFLVSILSYVFIIGEAFFTARRLKEIVMKSFNRWYYYFLFAVIAFAASSLVSNQYNIKPLNISSGSMMPTLLMGEHIITKTKYYNGDNSSKSDIVIFRTPDNPSLLSIKRIIAIEGDVIESRNKAVYLNGLLLNEPYIQHLDSGINTKASIVRDSFGPFTIPEGKVFIMGDNRDQSYDSRFFGSIDKTQIIGKACFIYWSEKRSRIGMEIK